MYLLKILFFGNFSFQLIVPRNNVWKPSKFWKKVDADNKWKPNKWPKY